MKKLSILLCFLIIGAFSSTFAQTQCFQIQKNDYESIQINFHFDIHNLKNTDVKTESGMFTRIFYNDLCLSREVGKPELPEFSELVEIPLCENVKINVINANYTIVDAEELGIQHSVFPAQPSYAKSAKGPFHLVKDSSCYQEDRFYGLDLASCQKVGISRNINLGNLTICPISYNPVSKKIKFYTDVEVEISYEGSNIPATLEMKNLHSNGFFSKEASPVINPIVETTRSDIEISPVKYLIVAHSMFRNNDQLNAFINWKKRIGYLVEIGYTDESNVGTTSTSIANFIKSHYTQATAENPAPTFLLLIGDVAQIPAFDSRNSSGDNDHVTDLYYACWTANDHIPDCYYGRFSAQNISQLTPQIQKTLMYEQYTMPDPSYLAKAVAIAGTDSYWGPKNADWQIHYLTDNYLNNANGFTTVYAHYYNCSSQAATIRQEIGAGVGFANYTAHGDVDGWYDPAFNNNHISSMNNANKYGLMIGNCCLSGKFDRNSFGEELLRANNKGAVGYIGASNVSLWPDDYTWAVGNRSTACLTTYDANNLGAYDKLWHTHNEAHTDWQVTNSGIIRAGNFAVESSSSNEKLYYWEIYHLFGDPSLKTYLGIPSEIQANVPSAMPIGIASLDITTVPYAYVALTQGNTLISACFANASGSASLVLPSTLIPGEYEVAISAQNHIQFFQNITFASPSSSFVICNATMQESSVLTNNSISSWNLSFENMGAVNANNTYAKISSSESNITFSTDSIYIGNIAAGQTVNLTNAFTAQIDAGVADHEATNISIKTYFDNSSSERNYNLTINAPQLEIGNIVINAGTASEGCINPGEDGTITVTFKNSGHNSIHNLQAMLTSLHNDITVSNGTNYISTINTDGSAQITYNITVSPQAQIASLYPMQVSIFNSEYQSAETYRIPIGKVVEDFETGGFSSFNWNNGNYPWEITTSNVYAGNYSARSKSNLGDGSFYSDKESILQITMTVSQASPISYFRKVSSEQNYDKFTFAIDGTVKEELSGEVAWGEASFDVPVGNHTFKFTYSKDYSTSNGSDCAWIDNITFPVSGAIIEPSSIENNEIDQQLHVYPNPANDQINIQCTNNMKSIEIIDIMGKSVKCLDNINGNNYTLNISNLANAIYFVKVVDNNNQVMVQKIIKK